MAYNQVSTDPTTPTSSSQTDGEFNIGTVKTFFHKKLQSASSLIKKPKPHTCKVTVGTADGENIQLMVSDGTFMSEGLVFLKGKLTKEKHTEGQGTMFAVEDIVELGFEFDLPYDINSTSMLNDVLDLHNLKALTLKTNCIVSMPVQISQMKNITNLSLAGNQLKSLVPELGNLVKLTVLNLSNNQLVSLPKEIGKFALLENLNVSQNYITSLPSTIIQLSNLKSLHCSNNRLSELPDLHGLNNLLELDLENNLLTYHSLSDSLIDKIKTITAVNSNLKTLANLISLVALNLKGNKLVSIPEWLVNIPSLQTCNLSYNSIQHCDLSSISIVSFDISHNILTSISSRIATNSVLKELNISANLLTSLPNELATMTSLISLNASGNKLGNKLEPIPDLKQLQNLNISNNQITSLPVSLSKLDRLQFLNVSKNELKTVPSSVIASLTELRKLDLSDNKLAALPYNISKLTSLKSLRLHSNRIVCLPRDLMQLNSLKGMSVSNVSVSESGDLQVIQKADEATPNIKVFDLISLMRSCPHYLLISILHLLSQEDEFQEKIIDEGGLVDIVHFMRTTKGRSQLEAAKVLANLSKNEVTRDLIIQEGAVDALIHVLVDNTVEVKTKIHALITLGNLSLNDDIRKRFVEMDELIATLLDIANTSHCDITVKKFCRRTLAILGVLDSVEPGRGIRILSMDGGGSKHMSSVESLRKIEELTGKRIFELFDLICGTSAGGLTAACIGMKQFTLDRIQFLQEKLAHEVFAHGTAQPPPSSSESNAFFDSLSTLSGKFTNATQILKSGSLYSAKQVEEMLQGIMGTEKLLIDTAMETDTKVFVISTLSNVFPPQIYVWRNYQYPIGSQSRYASTMTGKVWEALRATSCAPGYFEEFTCGNDKHQDGGCIANNPTAIAIHEAKCLWPNKKIDCIVSIGVGTPPPQQYKAGFIERTVVELIECAASTERIHDLMQDTFSPSVYFRFNPTDEKFNLELDESRKEKLEDIREAARQYIKSNEDRFVELAQLLVGNNTDDGWNPPPNSTSHRRQSSLMSSEGLVSCNLFGSPPSTGSPTSPTVPRSSSPPNPSSPSPTNEVPPPSSSFVPVASSLPIPVRKTRTSGEYKRGVKTSSTQTEHAQQQHSDS